MNVSSSHVVTLYDMADMVVEYNGRRYVFIPVLSQRIKRIDSELTSTIYRRWFQLIQFILNVTEVYGVPALDIDDQVKKGHVSSVSIKIRGDSGKDSIL